MIFWTRELASEAEANTKRAGLLLTLRAFVVRESENEVAILLVRSDRKPAYEYYMQMLTWYYPRGDLPGRLSLT